MTISKKITFKGKTQSLQDWAQDIGISPMGLKQRLDRGWPVKRALTTPRQNAGRLLGSRNQDASTRTIGVSLTPEVRKALDRMAEHYGLKTPRVLVTFIITKIVREWMAEHPEEETAREKEK